MEIFGSVLLLINSVIGLFAVVRYLKLLAIVDGRKYAK